MAGPLLPCRHLNHSVGLVPSAARGSPCPDPEQTWRPSGGAGAAGRGDPFSPQCRCSGAGTAAQLINGSRGALKPPGRPWPGCFLPGPRSLTPSPLPRALPGTSFVPSCCYSSTPAPAKHPVHQGRGVRARCGHAPPCQPSPRAGPGTFKGHPGNQMTPPPGSLEALPCLPRCAADSQCPAAGGGWPGEPGAPPWMLSGAAVGAGRRNPPFSCGCSFCSGHTWPYAPWAFCAACSERPSLCPKSPPYASIPALCPGGSKQR